ncbi:MAG: hypothetical protein KDA88_05420 [Planctomycetaceae bacterium]|nr:hypothetical protein [Planctomycetaceae bacterium]MCB9954147.1 hypothetical protein [Planctomycetaceae bacterium]
MGSSQKNPWPANNRYGFNTYELLAAATIISLLLWWLFTNIHRRPHSLPPEYHVNLALHNVQKALADCASETGSAPTTVEELQQILDTYLDVGGLDREMIATGNDYWGNRLQIDSVPDQPGIYSLRSLGPNGVLDKQEPSDDIVITYPAGPFEKSDETPLNDAE